MTIKKLTVMHQGSTPYCGFHALKNMLLALLWSKGKIEEAQFHRLLKDRKFYDAFYAATKPFSHFDDLMLPEMAQIIDSFDTDEYAFFEDFGIPASAVKEVEVGTYLAPVYSRGSGEVIGQGGFSTSLHLAVTLADIVRTDTPGTWAFPFGVAEAEHWVGMVMQRNADGERNYYFTNSFNNSNNNMQLAHDRLEQVLQMSEQAIKQYLVTAFKEYAKAEFSQFIGADLQIKRDDYLRVMWLSLAVLAQVLDASIDFAQKAGWLDNPGPEEKEALKPLYVMVAFALDNLDDYPEANALRERLTPFCQKLYTIFPDHFDADALPKGVQASTSLKIEVPSADDEEAPGQDIAQSDDAKPSPPPAATKAKVQKKAAAEAIQQSPKPSRGLFSALLNGIKRLWDKIKAFFKKIFSPRGPSSNG